MTTPIPLFRAVIVRINRFKDTNSTRIICRVTHAGLSGEDVHQLGISHKLANPPLVALRLHGADVLDQLADSYRTRLRSNEEMVINTGTTILFTAQGIQQWDGRAIFRGESMHRPDGWSLDSLSVIPRTKRLQLVFASPRSRVEAAAAVDRVPAMQAAPVLA